MMLKKQAVDTFVTKVFCPECGAELKMDNTVLATYPPKYGYTCPKCKFHQTSYDYYPKIEYVPYEPSDVNPTTEPPQSTKKVIAIVGKSGAGKDMIMEWIFDNFEEFNKIIHATTRPPRANEIDHIHYDFMSEKEFKQYKEKSQFISTQEFRGWFYGVRKDSFVTDKINIGVFNLADVQALLKMPEFDVYVLHIKANDNIRLIRQLDRGNDVKEVIRRYEADEKDFEKEMPIIRSECDKYMIVNNNARDWEDDETGMMFDNVQSILENLGVPLGDPI